MQLHSQPRYSASNLKRSDPSISPETKSGRLRHADESGPHFEEDWRREWLAFPRETRASIRPFAHNSLLQAEGGHVSDDDLDRRQSRDRQKEPRKHIWCIGQSTIRVQLVKSYGVTFHAIAMVCTGTGSRASKKCWSKILSRWTLWAGFLHIVTTDREYTAEVVLHEG